MLTLGSISQNFNLHHLYYVAGLLKPRLLKFILRVLVSLQGLPNAANPAMFNLFHLMARINQFPKFCITPKNIYFFHLTQKIGTILIHSHRTAIVVLAILFFVFDNVREQRSVPLAKLADIAYINNSRGHQFASCGKPVENLCASLQTILRVTRI